MTLEKAKQELEKFVQLKTTLRPAFVDVLLNAEEVVRCKDCWYSSVIPEEMQHVGEYLCDFWCAEMHEDDYCSCGKRRENDETG